jgi:DNA adenine methylase
MPPHEVYIETHLGGGAVMRNKRPARRQVGIDIDARVIEKWENDPSLPCELLCCDSVEYLENTLVEAGTLVYSDPPYFPSTRRRRRVYAHDYNDEDHERLIACLRRLPCLVMLSGYPNDLYETLLSGWTRSTFNSKTHVEVREEAVWMNFEPPSQLHDCSFLGNGFRQRELIKRRTERLRSRIRRLPRAEQYSLLTWLRGETEDRR